MATYFFRLTIVDDKNYCESAETMISTPWGDPADDDRDAVLRSSIPLLVGTYEKVMAQLKKKQTYRNPKEWV